jgi:hypothetical protein
MSIPKLTPRRASSPSKKNKKTDGPPLLFLFLEAPLLRGLYGLRLRLNALFVLRGEATGGSGGGFFEIGRESRIENPHDAASL